MRIDQGQSWFSFFEYFKKKNLEFSQLMFSSNVAVKLHHSGVVWYKTANK